MRDASRPSGSKVILKYSAVIHGKGERMCPGGSFGAVLDAISSPVQAALHRFAKMHLDWLEGTVREGRDAVSSKSMTSGPAT